MKQTIKFFTFFVLTAVAAFVSGCESANKTTGNRSAANGAKSTPVAAPTIPTNAPAGAQPANVLGSPTATVTVEEFADFQCPTCAQVHTMMKNIVSTYGNRIKFVYRSFPLTQIHKNAYDAAVAAEAAGQQGRFWDMQNQLYTTQPAWSNSTDARTIFADYAGKIGLDVEKFKTDMMAMTTKSRVDADIARARALGVNSTPSLYINNRPVPFEQMKLETLRAIIDAELQKGGAAQTTQPAPATGGAAAGNTGSATTNAPGNSANAANSPASNSTK